MPFDVIASGVSEAHLPRESPTDRALRLALEKAHALARQHPDAFIIGSDQVAACEGRVLDKPGDAARCREQLGALSGRTARFHTACALVNASGHLQQAHVDRTTVIFRVLAAAEIERYVAREQPFDCAGGFKAEGLGIALFEGIESQDPTGLIGLPLIWLAGALRAAGFQLP